VFTVRYGLIPYIKKITFGFYNRGEKCLQRGRTNSLYKRDPFGFYNRGEKCLQRGTD